MAEFKSYERIVRTSLSPSEVRSRILKNGEANDCSDHSMELDERMRDPETAAYAAGYMRYDPRVKRYNGEDPSKVVRLWFVPAYPVQAKLQFEIYKQPDGGSLIYCWSLGDEYKGSMYGKISAKATQILSGIPKTEDKYAASAGIDSSTLTVICLAIAFGAALLSTCS